MRKSLWLILLLAAWALYGAEPARPDVWAEFTWYGTESTPTETIHKYKLKLSPNFPVDQVALVLAVDVFGGGDYTPLRKLGNDFRLKYSVSPAKPRGGLVGRVLSRIVRGRGAGDIVADATLTFGGAPGHDWKIQFGCQKSPKLELMTRLVLYPGDVTPLCALTVPETPGGPTTEFRFSQWKKPPRAGLFLRIVIPDEVLAKVDKGVPYNVVLRHETLKRIGISPYMAGGCNLDELDSCIAAYETCRLRFETGTATLQALLEREIAVFEVFLNTKIDPHEKNELRRGYLKRQQRLLDLLKAEYRAGRIGIEPVRKKEREIAECRRKWGLPPADVFDPAFIGKVRQILVKHLGAPQLTFTCGGQTYCVWKLESSQNDLFLIFGSRGTTCLNQHKLQAALKKAGTPGPELSSLKPVSVESRKKAHQEISETVEAMFGKRHFSIGSGLVRDYWVFDDGTVLEYWWSLDGIEIRKLPPQYHTMTDDGERSKIFFDTLKGPLYEF